MLLENKKNIGKKIKQQRKRLKLTQFELAEKVGIHEKQLSRIEAGLHYPSLENFIKILNALGLKLAEFDDNEENSKIKDDIRHLLDESNTLELEMYHDVILSIKSNLYKKASAI